MKYLSDYTSDLQTKVFDETGAFFAFGKDQFNAEMKPDVSYIHVGAGLYVPKQNAAHLLVELENIQKQGIEADIAENGIKAIIHRELGNYETQLTNDLSAVIDTLADYPVTAQEIHLAYPEYYQECIDNDWF